MKEEKIKVITKAKLKYHAIKTKKNLITIIFSFILILKKHHDLNRKKHETKNKQIIEKTLFQQICNFLLKKN